MPFFEGAQDVQISGGKFKDINGDVTKYYNSTHNVDSHNSTANNTTNSHNNSSTQDNRKSDKHFKYASPINVINGVIQHGGNSGFKQNGSGQKTGNFAAQDHFIQQEKARQQAIRLLQEKGWYNSPEQHNFNIGVQGRKDESDDEWEDEPEQLEQRNQQSLLALAQQNTSSTSPPHIPYDSTPSHLKSNNPFRDAEIQQAPGRQYPGCS